MKDMCVQMAVAYIPLIILAVPAAVLSELTHMQAISGFLVIALSTMELGGGYLFGLPLGFCADSIGATMGAAVAFLLGRTGKFTMLFLGLFSITFSRLEPEGKLVMGLRDVSELSMHNLFQLLNNWVHFDTSVEWKHME